jgi:hypothetical protein
MADRANGKSTSIKSLNGIPEELNSRGSVRASGKSGLVAKAIHGIATDQNQTCIVIKIHLSDTQFNLDFTGLVIAFKIQGGLTPEERCVINVNTIGREKGVEDVELSFVVMLLD